MSTEALPPTTEQNSSQNVTPVLGKRKRGDDLALPCFLVANINNERKLFPFNPEKIVIAPPTQMRGGPYLAFPKYELNYDGKVKVVDIVLQTPDLSVVGPFFADMQQKDWDADKQTKGKYNFGLSNIPEKPQSELEKFTATIACIDKKVCEVILTKIKSWFASVGRMNYKDMTDDMIKNYIHGILSTDAYSACPYVLKVKFDTSKPLVVYDYGSNKDDQKIIRFNTIEKGAQCKLILKFSSIVFMVPSKEIYMSVQARRCLVTEQAGGKQEEGIWEFVSWN